ncbi:putative folate metabolism gamma-glutamate ligase [Candidatus Microgenomates bacterium]|nr:MAG: putative folate metabolism gamma-glutamate ligase [Candidatus Microgenomates bacterium]
MQVSAYKTHPIQPHENMEAILDTYLPEVSEKSVVAITSKIISLCQGRVVKNDGTVSKDDLVKQEAEHYIDASENQYGVHLSIKNNIMVASAGIDESNGNGYFVLWPRDLQKTAVEIWHYVRKKNNLQHVGIIITDSKLTPLRWGVTGIGIGYCGFAPLNDFRGTPDIFGRPLHVTQVNVLDGLASAAVVVMGEGREQTPLSVIADVPFVHFQDAPPTRQEYERLGISIKEDIFARLLDSKLWKKGQG